MVCRVLSQGLQVFLLTVLLTPAAWSKPPNLLLIVADDHGWTDYGFMGHKAVETPNLDRLAKQSEVYTRGYVPCNLDLPSFLTILTELYPHTHKVTADVSLRDAGGEALLKKFQWWPTLPKELRIRDYQSLLAADLPWAGHQALGFTHGLAPRDVVREGPLGRTNLSRGGEDLQPVIDFIEQRGEKPFFVCYAPRAPSETFDPPPRRP
jgi:hypothetical protein